MRTLRGRMLFDALRTLAYAACALLFFAWAVLRVRAYGESYRLAFPGAAAAGVILMGIGGALAILCIGNFVARGQGTPALFDPPRQFVVAGPYRYFRNPMYMGGFLVLVGLGLYWHSLAIVVMALVLISACHLLVLFYEEPTLKRKFGEAYLEYCGSVRRWLPRARGANRKRIPAGRQA